MRLVTRGTSRPLAGFIAGVLVLVAAPVSSARYLRPRETRQVDLTPTGEPATTGPGCSGPTYQCRVPVPSISENGRYVAFQSDAGDLVPGDTNLVTDVFVRDLKTGIVTRASVSSADDQASGTGLPQVCQERIDTNGLVDLSFDPSLNRNGRFVTFTSWAANLAPPDTNAQPDIFRRDLVKGITERVSVTSSEEEALHLSNNGCVGGGSERSSITADGQTVVFQSTGFNLDGRAPHCATPGSSAPECAAAVFLRDLRSGETHPISLREGDETVQHGGSPSIASRGRYVVFYSGTPLDGGEANPLPLSDVYLRDLESRTTERVSVTLDRQPLTATGICRLNAGAGPSNGLSVSRDGRFVTFSSVAQNLVPNDGNAVGLSYCGADAYVRDMAAERTYRVSVRSSGEELRDPPLGSVHEGLDPGISDDGRFVSFWTTYDVDSGKQAGPVVAVHDLVTGASTIASRSTSGETPNHAWGAQGYSFSSTGRYLAFASSATNFGEAKDGKWHVYVTDLGPALGIGAPPTRNPSSMNKLTPDDEGGPVCLIEGACIPSPGKLSSVDPTNELSPHLTDLGAELSGVGLAYRPQSQDLFVTIELAHMPRIGSITSPILHGLQFKAADRSLEVRAGSLLGGTFGLFDCTTLSRACTKIADLDGGYGTTGERVVFSLPLEAIGLQGGGELSGVQAFSAIGSLGSGPATILDTAILSPN